MIEERSEWKKAIMGAVARGWCHRENENKTMDPELAMAIVEEIEKQFEIFTNK